MDFLLGWGVFYNHQKFQVPTMEGLNLIRLLASSHISETIKKNVARWTRPPENHDARVEGQNPGRLCADA